MRVDHVGYAAGPEGLQAAARRLASLLGVRLVDGGPHPRFGTRNVVLPLSDGAYVEVVEVLDHPVAEKAVFGQAVRTRSDTGGGWFTWAVLVDDLASHEQRLGEPAEEGVRRRPDGVELRWRQIGAPGLREDPQLPLLIEWEGPSTQHPSAIALAGGTRLTGLTIAGDPERVQRWMGQGGGVTTTDHVEFTWEHTDSAGQPGLRSVTFQTPRGPVRV